jgi:hypothetical protein
MENLTEGDDARSEIPRNVRKCAGLLLFGDGESSSRRPAGAEESPDAPNGRKNRERGQRKFRAELNRPALRQPAAA